MNIVFLDGYTMNASSNVLHKLETFGQLTVYDRTRSDQIKEHAANADILIVNKTALSSEVLNKLPRLKLICVAATGYDKIDIQVARERGIPVCNCAGYSSEAVAQMAISLLLEAANNVGFYTEQNHEGKWSQCEDFCYTTRPRIDLCGKCLAIVGLGSIGKAIAQIAQSFGMKIFAVSSKPQSCLPSNITKISIEQAFQSCDIVSLNCPLTEDNREFVNATLLSKARKGLILLNTARGGLVNEQHVAEALNKGYLGAYCTDVLTQEPPQNDCAILHAANVYITPHIGWKTPQTVERIIEILAQNIAAFIAGNPQSVVN